MGYIILSTIFQQTYSMYRSISLKKTVYSFNNKYCADNFQTETYQIQFCPWHYVWASSTRDLLSLGMYPLECYKKEQ